MIDARRQRANVEESVPQRATVSRSADLGQFGAHRMQVKDAALCIDGLIEHHPFMTTTDWVCVRFHGPNPTGQPYRGTYGPHRLVSSTLRTATLRVASSGLTAVGMGYPHRMSATKHNPDNPGTGPSNRNTPDSMSQADRANGEASETDQVADAHEDAHDDAHDDDPAENGTRHGA